MKNERPQERLLEIAVDADIRGFAALERSIHPVHERSAGNVRYLHWPEEGRRGDAFTEQFFAVDLDAADVLNAIAAARPGPDHLIAEIAASTAPQHNAYLGAGYEIGSAEPLMIASLTDANCAAAIERMSQPVASIDEVGLISDAHRAIGYPVRQYSPAQLADPDISIRVIWIDGQPATVAKMAMLATSAYLTDVVTLPDYRRRGLAAAVIRALHADARARGITLSVLTSSAMGRTLYEKLGYESLGLLTLYVTPERA